MTKRSGPLRVLYVDDDEMALTLTQLQLLNAGMVTEATSDTLEAVGMLATEELDLILLDSVMPTIDGVEFLQLMRSLQFEYCGACDEPTPHRSLELPSQERPELFLLRRQF